MYKHNALKLIRAFGITALIIIAIFVAVIMISAKEMPRREYDPPSRTLVYYAENPKWSYAIATIHSYGEMTFARFSIDEKGYGSGTINRYDISGYYKNPLFDSVYLLEWYLPIPIITSDGTLVLDATLTCTETGAYFSRNEINVGDVLNETIYYSDDELSFKGMRMTAVSGPPNEISKLFNKLLSRLGNNPAYDLS